jgi:IMP dehydrogenase
MFFNLDFSWNIRNKLSHLDNPHELVDDRKRLLSAAAVNTHDYSERVPALVDAGVDILSIDSSDGFSVFQQKTLLWIKEHYPELPVIGGNIITDKGFDFLVENGANAIKVGMGGGSIRITQEQKGTGRGLATAVLEVSKARDQYYEKTGKYIPVIADGGIVHAKDIVIALALGADYVMLGRYFARMEESPTQKVTINNKVMKSYWGEGAARASQWKAIRYHHTKFAEGVEGFVEYAGKLRDNLDETLAKIKASLSSCGVSNIEELHEKAELELVSPLSIREGKVHDIYLPENDRDYYSMNWGD